MFDVKLFHLMEYLDHKYGIGTVGGYGAVGGRVCDRHQKIFNLMSFLRFFIIVICSPIIYTI